MITTAVAVINTES